MRGLLFVSVTEVYAYQLTAMIIHYTVSTRNVNIAYGIPRLKIKKMIRYTGWR